MRYHRNQEGYVALVSMLVIGAIGLSLIPTMLIIGVDQSRTAGVVAYAGEARSFADACADEALRQVKRDNNFVGGGSLLWPDGSCSYTVVSVGGEQRRIEASGVRGTITRKVLVEISALTPIITMSIWREVADF
ncbi:MAG: hypothetical protein Q8R39_02745 [bacterium]|nr:hypothetical protein [bacterium]MDZ4284473.1 hypothetical protein [Patescibacteria group bacterium]